MNDYSAGFALGVVATLVLGGLTLAVLVWTACQEDPAELDDY